MGCRQFVLSPAVWASSPSAAQRYVCTTSVAPAAALVRCTGTLSIGSLQMRCMPSWLSPTTHPLTLRSLPLLLPTTRAGKASFHHLQLLLSSYLFLAIGPEEPHASPTVVLLLVSHCLSTPAQHHRPSSVLQGTYYEKKGIRASLSFAYLDRLQAPRLIFLYLFVLAFFLFLRSSCHTALSLSQSPPVSDPLLRPSLCRGQPASLINPASRQMPTV